ncbi:MAG: sulfur oxidation c-type cytochrome SoxA, partial [Gammaproteobacteria bacterium]
MKPRFRSLAWLLGGLCSASVPILHAESSTAEAIAEYHAMFGDENPAELWQLRGEELWRQKRGPKNADLSG